MVHRGEAWRRPARRTRGRGQRSSPAASSAPSAPRGPRSRRPSSAIGDDGERASTPPDVRRSPRATRSCGTSTRRGSSHNVEGRHRARRRRRLDRRTRRRSRAAASERRTFGQPGTYTFHCEVHPGTMTGTLDGHRRPGRDAHPATPTATPTPTPTPGPSGTTPGARRPHHDAARPAAGAPPTRTAPALSGLALKGRRGSVASASGSPRRRR